MTPSVPIHPFGELICSNAGERPLPESIAAGDCDGDYYFVCWDSAVLEHMRTCEFSTGGNVAECGTDEKDANGVGQVKVNEKPATEDLGGAVVNNELLIRESAF